MNNLKQLCAVPRNCRWLILPLLSLFLCNTTFGQLSGTKYIGGTTPNYATIEEAITDLNTQGVIDPGVTFLISDGTYSSTNTLSIATTTGTATAPIIFKPDIGATVVVERTGTAGVVWQLATGVKYVTIDGSNSAGGTTQDLTIINTIAGTTYGLSALGNNPNCLFENINVDAGAGSTLNRNSTSSIGIRVHYSGAESNETKIINNYITNAGIGIRMEGNSVVLNNVISNNIIDNVGLVGIWALYASNTIISGNDIQVPEGTGTGSYGIQLGTSIQGNFRVYKNVIHNIKSNSTSTSTTLGITGIYCTSSATGGTPARAGAIFNNFIYDVDYTASTGSAPVYGIWFSAASPNASPDTIAYNSVSLTGTSDAIRNSAAFAFTSITTGHKLFLKNNILDNQSVYTTGLSWVILKSGTSAQTTLTSDNNDLYVGVTGGTRFTGRISATDYAAIGDWRTGSGGDNASFSEMPPFTSSTDLHIPDGTTTQLESGGVPLVNITTDIDGDTRNALTPDVGADEFSGIPADFTPPIISYTPLQNTSSISERTLTANISDFSGVTTSGIGLPVLYWNINGGIYTGVQGVYISGDLYSFTFGNGVIIGDVVNYYIVAEDMATPPNVGASPSGGAGGFTYDPPAASIPPTVPSSYTITNVSLNGDYTVGLAMFNKITGRNITFEKSIRKVTKEVNVPSVEKQIKEKSIENNSVDIVANGTKQLIEIEEISWIPMENGKVYTGELYVKKSENPRLNFPQNVMGVYATISAATADLNLRGVSGNTNFLLTDPSYPTETFPIIINVTNENIPTAASVVTFKPAAGVISSISGSSASSQIFKILNSYITIDGSNSGGSSRDLTIENTSTTTPQVLVVGSSGTTPITNVTIKNCNIINGINSSSALIVSDGSIPGNPGWFNNITISNNTIQKSYIGNYNNAVVSAGNGTGFNISFNELNLSGANSIRFAGIYLQGIDGASVTDNKIANFDGTSGEDDRGIWFATGTTNSVIERNSVSTLKYTGTGGYGAHGFTISTGMLNANITIKNNIVYDLSGDGWNYTTIIGDNTHGIYIFSTQSGIKVYYNTIYLYGNTLNQSNAISSGITLGTGSVAELADNNIVNNLGLLTTTGYGSIGIFLQSTATQLTSSNYNNIYVNPSGSGTVNIGQIAAIGYTTLIDWQTVASQDLNSISANPQFVSSTDLRPLDNSPLLNAATPVTGITTDFLGATRSATTPTIGAYEQAVYLPLAPGVYTIGLSAFKEITGKNVYFETKTIKEKINLNASDSYLDNSVQTDTKDKNEQKPQLKFSGSIEVDKTVKVLMENGKPFDHSFYRTKESRGVYPTITEAVNDLNLRGIAGPVTFLLVDNAYPNETYPIAVFEVAGASASNTVTFKPGTGVVTQIPGSTVQPTSTFQLGGADYVIIDGSNTDNGTTKDLTINSLTADAPAFHFYGGADNNIVKNTLFTSLNTNTGSGTFLFGDGASGNNNLVENCSVKANDTSAIHHAIGIYMFSNNYSSGNQILNCDVTGFDSYGMYLRGAPSNIIVSSNLIDQVNPSNATTVAGMRIDGAAGLINGNYFLNLNSSASSPSVYGIYYYGINSTMDVIIQNNVVSLGDLTFSGTIRGIDYWGYTPNSVEMYFNTVFIGGTNITGGSSYGITKRAGTVDYKVYDNAVYNSRSNGTGTGAHYGIYVSSTASTVFELNNNDYYPDGTGAILGYYGSTNYNTLSDWQAATSQDANSLNSNPEFISDTDFRPASTSPLIGAGLTISGITSDILGDLRNDPPTIGAYENSIVVAIAAPSELIAIGDTNIVSLQWVDNSTNETGFVIERRLGDTLSVNSFEIIDSVAADVQNYLDHNVLPQTTYTYRVYAYNSATVSDYSNIAQATTPVPVELTSFTANAGENSVTINWSTATEINNNGFELQRKIKDNWEELTFIKGKGTTTEKSDYIFIDDFKYQSVSGVISYRLKQIDLNGTFNYSSQINVTVDFTPKEYALYQNYPNPFNPSTKIKFALPFNSHVKISVYNILGQLVEVLLDADRTVGYHDIQWGGFNNPSGMYIYTIYAKSTDGKKDYTSVKKMMLVK